jgi:hypothetical protein
MKIDKKIEITKEEYTKLVHKANGFDLSTKCFDEIRNEINPTKEDLTLPWYEMLSKCIKNRQFKNK